MIIRGQHFVSRFRRGDFDMMDKRIMEVINVLNLGGNKIWYVPIRNEGTLENYNNAVLNKITFDGEKLDASYWAFKSGPKNKSNFDAMGTGDYVCFIGRDSEGYEFIDSIATLYDKYINSKEGLKNWNDSQYELIIKFDSVFVLKSKLRLTKNRIKLDNILENIPSEIFHNGYEMFRVWNLNKKLSRTKLGPKLIEEDEFISIIKESSQGTYIDDTNSEQEIVESEVLHSNDGKKYINEQVEDFLTICNEDLFRNLNGVKVETRNRNEKDGNTSLNAKPLTQIKEKNNLSKKNQQLIGWTGEKFVYKLLLNGHEKLLEALGIKSKEEITKIEWSNLEYDSGDGDFRDLSLGHDIKVSTKAKSLQLEVKTSFNNSGYYSITRNELKEMASYKENYFIVKVNYLHRLENGGTPEVILENFPIFNVLENLNRIKAMDVYL